MLAASTPETTFTIKYKPCLTLLVLVFRPSQPLRSQPVAPLNTGGAVLIWPKTAPRPPSLLPSKAILHSNVIAAWNGFSLLQSSIREVPHFSSTPSSVSVRCRYGPPARTDTAGQQGKRASAQPALRFRGHAREQSAVPLSQRHHLTRGHEVAGLEPVELDAARRLPTVCGTGLVSATAVTLQHPSVSRRRLCVFHSQHYLESLRRMPHPNITHRRFVQAETELLDVNTIEPTCLGHPNPARVCVVHH